MEVTSVDKNVKIPNDGDVADGATTVAPSDDSSAVDLDRNTLGSDFGSSPGAAHVRQNVHISGSVPQTEQTFSQQLFDSKQR